MGRRASVPDTTREAEVMAMVVERRSIKPAAKAAVVWESLMVYLLSNARSRGGAVLQTF